MPATCDPLASAIERLEGAISEDPRTHSSEWVETTESALESIQREIREHLAGLALPSSEVSKIDRPLLPSPGLHRHASSLRREYYGYLDEARFLGSRAAVDAHNPDAPFFERAHRLVHDLRDCEEREYELIQGAVSTDIGAGE